MQLYGDERLDYVVSDETLQVIQSPSVFSYSLDAVLLAHFASIPIAKGNILELCSGNGIIPLLLSKRTKAHIQGLEIQPRLVEMANRNITLNKLTEQITIKEGNLTERQPDLQQSYFDSVICNPPYFPTPKVTEHNVNEHLTIARHEVFCNLDDVIAACRLYVKPRGKVSIVHRPERLVDIMTTMKLHRIEPKRMQLIYPKTGKEANILLVEGIRDGNPGLKIHPPLIVYEADGTYTDTAKDVIYGKR